MALYATPAELASYLQQDLDTATATLVLTVASGQFSLYADTQFASTAATWTTLGTPFMNLVLPFRPVIAVQAVRISGVTVNGYTLIRNILYRPAGFGFPFATPPDAVQVDLTYGFTAVPDDVKAAVLDMAAQAYTVPVGAVIAENIDDYAVRYANAAGGVQLTPFARDLAAFYRGTLAA
jgi:glucan biosynthesis protein